jgi:hypothetical protein
MLHKEIKKITFFGASVTAQKAPSGYTHHVSQILSEDGIEVDSVAYGACHFDDAGFFKSSSVIALKPDLCVFEWCTTGLSQFDLMKLRSVFLEFFEAKIKMGILILPRTDTNLTQNRPCELQLIEIAQELSIPLLDLRGKVKVNQCVRDKVHTNEVGASVYGGLVSEWIKSSNFMIPSTPSDWIRLPDRVCFNEAFEVSKTQCLIITAKSFANVNSEILIEVMVGPSIIDIELTKNGAMQHKSFFDQWCYFERRMFYSIFKNKTPIDSGLTIELKASALEPDLSVIGDKEYFRDHENLKLKILGVYAFGLDIQALQRTSLS